MSGHYIHTTDTISEETTAYIIGATKVDKTTNRGKTMKTIEYRTIDKSQWGEGAWQHEPDKKQWLDQETKYPCLIVRSPVSGSLCGYVGVPESHPSHGKKTAQLENDYEAHGGITFAGECQKVPEGLESIGVCHVSNNNEKIWWVGFDTAHAFDYMPKIGSLIKDFPSLETSKELEQLLPEDSCFKEKYRDLVYVTAECESLARQLKVLEQLLESKQ